MSGVGVEATRGVFWIGGAQVFRQILGVITSVVLARFLGPDAFGLIAMAYVFVELAQLFADFGIGAAIIHAQDSDDTTLSTCFWANSAIGLGLMAITAACAPLIADFYGDPRLTAIVVVLSLTMLWSGMVVVPRAKLQRDMRFDGVVKSQMFGSLIGALVAIGGAALGLGIWSLVLQPVIGSAMTLILTLWYARWRPRRAFSWQSIRGLMQFSMDVLGTSVIGYAGLNADKLIIGRFLGALPLGYYSMASQLMVYPMTHVAGVIVKVLFPALSRLRDDPARFQAAWCQATGAIALVTFPLMIGLFMVSDDFVQVVFGATWAPMVPVVDLLCFSGMVNSVSTTAGSVYLSGGHTRAMLRVSVISTPVKIVSLFIGLPWGIVGVAASYTVIHIIMALIYVGIALHLSGIRAQRWIASVVRPLGAAMAMALVVWGIRHGADLAGIASPVIRLAISVAGGITAYAGLSLAINRNQLLKLTRLVRSASGVGAPQEP